MSTNIDPLKIYKIIRDSGKNEKGDVIRCLESVAGEAEELYVTWEKIIELSNKKSKISKNDLKNVYKTKLFGESTPLYGRIINFYRNINESFENKLDFSWIENIYENVAQVILYKKEIKETLSKFNKIKWSQTPIYLSINNTDKIIKDLNSSLQVLQNEVKILKSLPGMINSLSTVELAKV